MAKIYAFAISATLLAHWVDNNAVTQQPKWMAAADTAAPSDAGVGGNGSNPSPLFLCPANQFRPPLKPGC